MAATAETSQTTTTPSSESGPKPLITVTKYVFSISVLFGVWWFFTEAVPNPPSEGLLPPPGKVLHSLVTEWSGYYSDFAFATISKALAGASIGITLGLIIGLLIGYSQPLRTVFEPFLTIFQSFPREALYPLFVVAMGFGDRPQITNAALLSFFPIALSTVHGLTDTRREYVDLIRSWGGSRLQEFLHVRLPYIVPTLVGQVKLAAPFALIGAVLAEMLGGGVRPGLGNLIASAQAGQNATSTYAAIIILALIGVGLVAVTQLVEYTFLRRFRHG